MKHFFISFLTFLARRIIKKYRPSIVGITGSYGKTSTKEAIYAVLGQQALVWRSRGNYNNEIGLPLSVIGMESGNRSFFKWIQIFLTALRLLLFRNSHYPQVLVLEMGADHPGDIARLLEIAQCDIGVLTSIGSDHLEFFQTKEKIAREKRLVISHLSKEGYAIINADDDIAVRQKKHTKAHVLTYGFSKEADVQLIEVDTYQDGGDVNGLSFKLRYQGSVVPVFLPGVIGENSLYAALAGAAVGISRGMNLVSVAKGLEQYEPPRGRMTLVKGIKHTMILDDTYKGGPEATVSGIKSLAKIVVGESSRRIAVLGDMLELGGETETAHYEVGRQVVSSGVDILITVGSLGMMIAHGAKEAGMSGDKIFSFDYSEAAGRFLQDRMKRGDVIFVKGSQSVRMERIVKEVMADPLNASDLLVRQSSQWLAM